MKDQVLIDLHNPVISGHQVYGAHVFPGLAYVDLLHQVFREQGYEYAEVMLRNLAIHHALLAEDGCETLLDIECSPSNKRSWQIVVEGELRRDGALVGTKRRYATAEFCATASPIFEETLDLAAIEKSVTRVIDAEQIYQSYRDRGLLHQGLMKARGKLYVSEVALYADLCLSEEGLPGADSLMFHPALLDASAVLAGGILISPETTKELSVPLSYESFRASALVQKRCLTRIPFASLRRLKGLSYLTMELFDGSGIKVAEMTNLACQMIGDNSQFYSSKGRGQVTDRWLPRRTQDVSDTPPEVGGEKGMGAAMEAERFLRRLLAKQLGASPEHIDTRKNFAAMALASADLLSLVRDIEVWAGRNLPPTLLFEYTTIVELASYLGGPSCSQSNPKSGALGGSGQDNRKPEVTAPASIELKRAFAHRDGIALIGMSGCFPDATSLDQFWDNLKSRKDCIMEIPVERWDKNEYFDPEPGKPGKTRCKWGGFIDGVDEFDPLFFSISPHEAELMDPQVRRFLETVWALLEGAAYTREQLRTIYKGSVGVYVGCMYQYYKAPDHDPASDSLRSLSSYAAIANRVSHFFGLQGPSIAVDTMCSSSATAIHLACRALIQGDCELAIAGGVNLSIDPQKYVGLSAAQLIASNADSRSFGQGDGYIPAEAVGAVLLKPVDRAIEDGDTILAVIKTTAINHSGSSTGYNVPDPNAQAGLIEKVLTEARIDARMVSYVEASAAGSASADLIEVGALCKVFNSVSMSRQSCGLGSVKSNIGHAEAASGITQLAKVIMQLRHGLLTPSLNPAPVNPRLCLEETPFYFPQDVQEWERPRISVNGVAQEVPRLALINSFGAGGSYASMLIEEYVFPVVQSATHTIGVFDPQIVVLSARTTERLRAVARQLLDYAERHEHLSLPDFAYTLQTGREAMEARLAMVVRSREELLETLRGCVQGRNEDGSGKGNPVFAGELHDDSQLGELRSGRMAEAITRILLEERNFHKIGELWTRGVEIPWELLHGTVRPRRLLLPTYPFLRDRYWVNADNHSMNANEMEVDNAVVKVEVPRESQRWQIQDFIKRFLAQALHIREQELHEKRSFQAYGLDSIVGMRLARALEQQFGTPVTGSVLLEHRSVDSLSTYLESQLMKSAGGASAAAAEDPSVENDPTDSGAADRAITALEQFRAGTMSRHAVEAFIEQSVIV